MSKKILNAALIAALFMIGSVANAIAQDTISPQKRALIKEMISVTDFQKASEAMMKASAEQYEKAEPARIAESVNAMPGLTPQEREKLIKEMTEDSARYMKRFQELARQKIDLGQLMEELIYPVLDKYFTEDDLKVMVDFYKTPTGRKSLEMMPRMMTDIMARSDVVIKPKFDEITWQIIEEEKKRLQK